jgi:hypothetical protein
MVAFARKLRSGGRRRFVRVPLGATVEFSAESDEFLFSMEGMGRDISLGGMFIETEILCGFGERIVVHVTLPAHSHPMALNATVRWTCFAGMGVQFGLLGARHTHEIAEFTNR